ncbi:MAG TPA: phosphatase PAP2 family protein [Micromonosporaceae bacterium]
MIARPPLAVPIAALAGYLVLLGLVATDWPPLARTDATISAAFRSYGEDRPEFVAALRVITDVAATVPFIMIGFAAVLLLRSCGDLRGALLCATVTPLVPTLWLLMHQLLHRPRPRDGFVTVDSNGFPSGHATMAAASALVVVLLLWPRLTRGPRLTVAFLAGGFAVFIGFTRVALLAHWPADVVGGWLLALAVVPLAARLIGPAAEAAAGPSGRR